MKLIFTALFLFFLHTTYAQNDFIVLQKKGRTIQRYFAGNNISFYTNEGFLITGNIKKCVHDSLFIDIPITMDIHTIFGIVPDTTGFTYYKININKIAMIPAKRMCAAAFGNTAIRAGVLIGSIFLANKIDFPDNQNATYALQFFMTAAINVGMAFVKPFNTNKPTGYTIGHKYKLVFMHVSNP